MKPSPKLILALVPMLFVFQSYANPFNGMYAGLGVNEVNSYINSNWNIQNSAIGGSTIAVPPSSATTLNSSANNSRRSPALNVFIGYGKTFGQYYVATELGYITDSKTIQASQYNTSGSITSNYTNEASITSQINLGLKLGILINANNLLYLRPAFDYAKLKNVQNFSSSNAGISAYGSLPVTYTQLSNGYSTLWGGQIGLGFEHAFSSRFAMQAEATYVRYATTTVNSQAQTASSSTSFKPSEYRLGVSIIYHF